MRSYEIAVDKIKVQFEDGAEYLYTNQSAGIYNIDRMKALAIKGHGLNSFISTTVKKRYASKLR